MKNKKVSLIALLIGLATITFSQEVKPGPGATSDTARINALIKESKGLIAKEPDKAIQLAQQAKEEAEKIDFKQGVGYALKNIGLVYYSQAKYVETLDYWEQSLKIFEDIKDDIGIANLLSNIGTLYSNKGDETRGLEYALRSLKIAEKTGDKLRILTTLNNIATIYYNRPDSLDKAKALDYLLAGLPLCDSTGNMDGLGILSENVGEIYLGWDQLDKAQSYFEKSIKALGDAPNSSVAYNGIGKIYLKKGDYNQAFNYHSKALSIAEKAKSPRHIEGTLRDIANLYAKQNNYATALSYFERSRLIAEDLKAVPDLKDIYSGMAIAYEKTNDYKNAFKYQSLLGNIKDTLFNLDREKKLGSLQFEFDLEKKQSEINLLTKDKDLQIVQTKRQKFAKNAFMIGLFLAFIIAALIYRSYRDKVKTHILVDRQKNEIEHLLLNVLPKEVAKELQLTGRATPKHYKSVAVMFTDFRGFTLLTDHMSPDELVAELDACFNIFDEIIAKHNLEKIKTIGDSYMCAGGIPKEDEMYVLKIVRAGLEIQEYIVSNNERRLEKGLEPWYLRIGIHVGPVVAGVVGKMKYAYDIWGSTVNIASRMESNGEPGKVNISSATYELIKDYYECSHRGKISAKNVGEIDMYFIEHERRIPLTLTNTESEVINQ
ncbi:MAG TPA: adenylate/guanylate cyclase domain-containing protein [Chitinophagaceae bacterium]|jgi:class 3 adenylate cyclase|nr:adenylate/guanylate cyclase domain-containing protein [Chitinophagaceae bacterium]